MNADVFKLINPSKSNTNIWENELSSVLFGLSQYFNSKHINSKRNYELVVLLFLTSAPNKSNKKHLLETNVIGCKKRKVKIYKYNKENSP